MEGLDAAALVFSALLLLGGLRSAAMWIGRPYESPALGDQVLYAANLTGRIGMWFALSGAFAGFALVEEPQRFRWYLFVPIALAVAQLVTAVLLGRRAPGD